MDPKTLGRRIRELREARGMSSPHLAKLSDLDRSDLWRIENGLGPKSIGVTRLSRISRALGVTLGELLSLPVRRRRSGAAPRCVCSSN